jgi:hypothetical protein
VSMFVCPHAPKLEKKKANTREDRWSWTPRSSVACIFETSCWRFEDLVFTQVCSKVLCYIPSRQKEKGRCVHVLSLALSMLDNIQYEAPSDNNTETGTHYIQGFGLGQRTDPIFCWKWQRWNN